MTDKMTFDAANATLNNQMHAAGLRKGTAALRAVNIMQRLGLTQDDIRKNRF